MEKTGRYDEREVDLLRSYAEQVKGGKVAIGDAAEKAAKELGRNPRGVRLYLGRLAGRPRTGRRAGGSRRPRTRPFRKDATVSQMGRQIEKVAAYRNRKAAERDRLAAEVSELDAELSRMRDTLLGRLGVATLDSVDETGEA